MKKTEHAKVILIGSWFVFHFLAQLYAPIRYVSRITTHSPQRAVIKPAQTESRYRIFYYYLHVFKLFHPWALFVNPVVVSSRFTVQTREVKEQVPFGFYLNNSTPKDFNYFQRRTQGILTQLSQLPELSQDMLFQFVGKDACKKMNLSGHVQVNHYRSFFNLYFTPEKFETDKRTSTVICEGPILWGS